MNDETNTEAVEEVNETEVEISTVDDGEGSAELPVSEPEAVQPVAEVPKEELGIKETTELLKAFDVVAELIAKVFADGKLRASDFFHVVNSLRDFDTIVDAVKDVDKVDDELKDLDKEELVALGSQTYLLLKKITASVK